MPKFTDSQNFQAAEGIKFSGAKIERLQESSYTICGIATDTTGSLFGLEDELLEALKNAAKALQATPNKHNILLRTTYFDSHRPNGGIEEAHGFIPVNTLDVDAEYPPIKTGGMTPLFAATFEGLVANFDYGRTLYDSDFDVNTIFFVITDGDDNMGGKTPEDIKALIDGVKKSEEVDSIVTILIGLNVQSCRSSLESFKNRAGLDLFLELPDTSPASMAKLTGLVSSSIQSQSDNLLNNGLTGKSAVLTF